MKKNHSEFRMLISRRAQFMLRGEQNSFFTCAEIQSFRRVIIYDAAKLVSIKRSCEVDGRKKQLRSDN